MTSKVAVRPSKDETAKTPAEPDLPGDGGKPPPAWRGKASGSVRSKSCTVKAMMQLVLDPMKLRRQDMAKQHHHHQQGQHKLTPPPAPAAAADIDLIAISCALRLLAAARRPARAAKPSISVGGLVWSGAVCAAGAAGPAVNLWWLCGQCLGEWHRRTCPGLFARLVQSSRLDPTV